MKATDNYAIDLTKVTKIYKKRVHALQGINMQVNRGEIFGLLGPNGAGKSTLVKIMMTVVAPTHAEGSILGQPVGHKTTLERVGYLPENHRFPRYLTGRQTLEFFAAMSKVPAADRRKRADELLETVGMTSWADTKIGQYSKGMLQRVGIAQALMNNPDLVLLDEPTDGVDPVGRKEIRDVLARMRSEGRTVFVNSHLLSELELICDRVAILVKGNVAKQGTIDQLTVTKQRYEIDLVAVPPDPRGQIRQALSQYCNVRWNANVGNGPVDRGLLSDGTAIEIEGATIRILSTDIPLIQPLIDGLRKAKLDVRRVQPMRPSLEDLFIEAVGGIAGGHQAGAALNAPEARP